MMYSERFSQKGEFMMSKAHTAHFATAGTSTYGARSGCSRNSRSVGLRRSISLAASILCCLSFSASAEAASKTENPEYALTAFFVGEAIGRAYITAQYEGGIPATLEMGKLRDRLYNQNTCLASLIGEIDGVIQRLRTARTKQQAINIIGEFQHAAANRVYDYCGCKPIDMQFYGVSQPPYGGGRYCLTEKEAADFRAKGAVVRPLGTPCSK
jgi:hypothetical protein